jgi:hypothetical protein
MRPHEPNSPPLRLAVAFAPPDLTDDANPTLPLLFSLFFAARQQPTVIQRRARWLHAKLNAARRAS